VINFRYHIVSLTAVFLALAIGLVVGTAALNGPVADNLSDQYGQATARNQQLRDRVDSLTTEVNKQEQFAVEAAPLLLTDRLAGKRVLVVTMPAVSKSVDDLVKMLNLAGAKLTGRVQLEDKFADPTNNDQLLDLALSAAPPGVRGTLPSNSNGPETSAALLAAVLVGGTAVDGMRTVLTAYSSQGYISVTGEITGPAEAVVFLAGPAFVDQDAAKKNAAVLTVVDRFDQAGKIVAAGSGDGGDGNVVRAVRNDAALTKTVSTVDNLTTSQGRVATVLAVVEQIEGRAGQYGNSAGATSLLPKPVSARDGS
jgi:type III secretion system FlhB-like substrate exporter